MGIVMGIVHAPSSLDQTVLQLSLSGKSIDLTCATSKLLYKEIRSEKQTPPTAKAKISSRYPDISVDWKRLFLSFRNYFRHQA